MDAPSEDLRSGTLKIAGLGLDLGMNRAGRLSKASICAARSSRLHSAHRLERRRSRFEESPIALALRLDRLDTLIGMSIFLLCGRFDAGVKLPMKKRKPFQALP